MNEEQILERLNGPGLRAGELLDEIQAEDRAGLLASPKACRAVATALIGQGFPIRAFELVREALGNDGTDPGLEYLRALALERGGSRSKAREYVERLLTRSGLSRDLRVEALSLAGKIHKRRCADEHEDRATCARVAKERYALAHGLSKGDLASSSFPGINAAAMALLQGEREEAFALAQGIREGVEPLARTSQDLWLHATLGEALLILGEREAALDAYGRAVELARGELGSLASMSFDLRLLRAALEIDERFFALFDLGRVVVFSGHMIDRAERPRPRFPAERSLIRKVEGALADELQRLEARVGYCSVASGSDILFAERMLERRGELHVVLPFELTDFYETSVDYAPLDPSRGAQPWRARCEAVLRAAAGNVHYATKEKYLNDEGLFEFVNDFTQGLALLRAAEMGMQPCALAVLDASAARLRGGTAYFVDRWTDGKRMLRTIDLASLRSGPQGDAHSATVSVPAPVTPGRREVKSMLFADIVGFSKLEEGQAPAFFMDVLGEVADVLRTGAPPLFQNTWGDGLFAVFERASDCADRALCLLERITSLDFVSRGLPADLTIRVAVHSGPVYRNPDPIIGRDNFFGSHVNRAARIEPVTSPGCVFASEQFAATLTLEAAELYLCEYLEIKELPKGFDRCPLYRLSRR